jgi:hypothetical protein
VKSRGQRSERGVIQIIEEAVHLLRLASPGTLATYYVGSVPFVLSLLYFWADLSRNPFAGGYASAAALGLALMFVWMKCWQAVFTERLLAGLRNAEAERMTLARLGRLVTLQAFLQSTGLVVIPMAAVMALPLPWVYTFYQNVTVLGQGRDSGWRRIAGQAWDQAKVWPWPNHLVLGVLFIFGFVVFLNLAAVVLWTPGLIRDLLGVESVFTRSGIHALNTTFLMITTGLTYLCLDPLIKAVYALRCYYGLSIRTGEDLRVDLSRLGSLGVKILFLAGMGTGLWWASVPSVSPAAVGEMITGVQAHETGVGMNPAVPPQRLEQSIREVLNQREYTWRLPRDENKTDQVKEPGMLADFFEWLGEQIRAGYRAVKSWFEKAAEWWENLFPKKTPKPGSKSGSIDWTSSLHVILLAGLGILGTVLAVVLWRTWRHRVREPVVKAVAVAAKVPDLRDDTVGAEQLPGDGWLALARQMMDKGELRLALRALYLATLARLAEREMISLARYKSNREYELELNRHVRSSPEVMDRFSHNVLMFDRAWYGRHEVNRNDLNRFLANQEGLLNTVDTSFGPPPVALAEPGRV